MVAILTPKAVSGQPVGPREWGGAPPSPEKSEKSHNGGRFYRDGDRPDVVVVLLDYLNFAQEEEADRILPRDDPEGLVGRA